MDTKLANWILDSEELLGSASPQDRLATVSALFSQVAMDSSVQGRAIREADRNQVRQALAEHLVRTTMSFFEERTK